MKCKFRKIGTRQASAQQLRTLRETETATNPTPREREILTLIAEGRTQRQAALSLDIAYHSVTNALGHMRDRYTTPTNECLIALAVRLQWIAVAIECLDAQT